MRRIATTLVVAGIIVSQAAYAQVTLNFVNADIDQVAKAIGAATGKTIIVDPRVKGQLNLVAERPVPEEQALKTLQSALRMQGFALVQDHGVLKVVPEADAKLQGVPTYVGNTPQARGDQVITQVFELHNESANNLLPVLRPLISPNNTVTAYPANNTIVVTDYADNVRRIAQIIAGVDSAAGAQVQVVPLRNANAIDLAAQLQKMLDPGAIGNSDATLKVSVTADPRTNSLLLRASSASRLAAAKRLVQQLDAPSAVPGNMHVVPLRNADAVKLAKTLRGMLGKGGNDSGSSASSNDANSFNQNGGSSSSGNFSTGTSGTPPLPSGGLGGSSSSAYGGGASGSGGMGSAGLLGGDKDKGDDNQPGGMIQADAATNSLIITASDPVYRNLRSVIDQLDARRAQVYIEALIVELNSTTQGNLGIQWQVASGQFLGGTNLNPTSGLGNSIVNLTAGTAGATTPGLAANLGTLTQGLNIGWLHNLFGVQSLGALLQYFAGVSDANVLSTPNLITLDNEEAKIVVGQNVPIATGSYSNLTSGTTSNAFNTYDRRDVGLTLHVKPQITDGGILKLQLDYGRLGGRRRHDQRADGADLHEALDPVDDPRRQRRDHRARRPDAGQLPGVEQQGAAARRHPVDRPAVPLESKQRAKTNLMVFLRPVIISDRNVAQEVTANRYDYIQGVTGAYKSDNNVMRDKDDPIVPPMPLGPSQGGTPAGNLFDLDKMRRQQMQRQVAPVPAQPLPEQTPVQPQSVPQQTVPQQPLSATPGASQ
jgi:general secretion pathway protein D